MKRNIRILIIVAAAALLASLAIVFLSRHDPAYQNRTINAWLDDLAKPPYYTKAKNDAKAWIISIGPPAAPYIIRRLKHANSPSHRLYVRAYNKFPSRLKRILPAPEPELEEAEAATILCSIGPSIKPLIVPMLKDSGPSVRAAGAMSLGLLKSHKKTDIRDTIPLLVEGLHDDDAQVRLYSASALGHLGPDSTAAIPGLITCLSDPETGRVPGSIFFVRSAAARALGKIGPNAKNALPALRAILEKNDASSHDSYLRMVTAVAIWRIDGDITNTLPVLIDEFHKVTIDSTWEVIEGLQEMGPQAKDAVPMLTEYLGDTLLKRQRANTFSYNCEKITNALLKIDPATAAKLGIR